MSNWKRPTWSKARQEQFEGDWADFEEKDAQRMGAKVHPRSGAGPFKKLDASSGEFGDFATDNKRTERKSYSVKRDYWRERQQQAKRQGSNFRESLLFVDTDYPEGHERRELHLVVIEGSVFEAMMRDLQNP